MKEDQIILIGVGALAFIYLGTLTAAQGAAAGSGMGIRREIDETAEWAGEKTAAVAGAAEDLWNLITGGSKPTYSVMQTEEQLLAALRARTTQPSVYPVDYLNPVQPIVPAVSTNANGSLYEGKWVYGATGWYVK